MDRFGSGCDACVNKFAYLGQRLIISVPRRKEGDGKNRALALVSAEEGGSRVDRWIPRHPSCCWRFPRVPKDSLPDIETKGDGGDTRARDNIPASLGLSCYDGAAQRHHPLVPWQSFLTPDEDTSTV